jgi:hypothetical protein
MEVTDLRWVGCPSRRHSGVSSVKVEWFRQTPLNLERLWPEITYMPPYCRLPLRPFILVDIRVRVRRDTPNCAVCAACVDGALCPSVGCSRYVCRHYHNWWLMRPWLSVRGGSNWRMGVASASFETSPPHDLLLASRSAALTGHHTASLTLEPGSRTT